MSFDFNPDLEFEEPSKKPKGKEVPSKVEQELVQTETALVTNNIASPDVVTMNNLLGITQSHINDDNECREVIRDLTNELNDSIRLMSIKELIEYFKAKVREREFHVDCIFKAYSFVQKSEFAREMFAGKNRKERIIEASDRKRITGLLNMLNQTD